MNNVVCSKIKRSGYWGLFLP